MLSREELLKSPEYAFEVIQNELYRQLEDYLKTNNMSQSEFAEKIGVTKGYISQIMKGNFNYTLKKLIELSLAIGKIPSVTFNEIDAFIKNKDNSVEIKARPVVIKIELSMSYSIQGNRNSAANINMKAANQYNKINKNCLTPCLN